MADYSDFAIKWDLLVSDAWCDADLKKRLMDDPCCVMKERGIDVPDGMDVQVFENTEMTKHYVIPCCPAEEELSEEQLESVAGGFSGHHSGHHSFHCFHCGHHSSHSGGHSGYHSGHFC